MKFISYTLALLGVVGAVRVNERHSGTVPPARIMSLIESESSVFAAGSNSTYSNEFVTWLKTTKDIESFLNVAIIPKEALQSLL